MFGKKSHEEAIYESHYMDFWIKVYPSHVDFKDSKGSKSIPINQIASVQLDRMGLLQITIETSGGRKYTIPAMKRKGIQRAIHDAQARLAANSNGSANTAYENCKVLRLDAKGSHQSSGI